MNGSESVLGMETTPDACNARSFTVLLDTGYFGVAPFVTVMVYDAVAIASPFDEAGMVRDVGVALLDMLQGVMMPFSSVILALEMLMSGGGGGCPEATPCDDVGDVGRMDKSESPTMPCREGLYG